MALPAIRKDGGGRTNRPTLRGSKTRGSLGDLAEAVQAIIPLDGDSLKRLMKSKRGIDLGAGRVVAVLVKQGERVTAGQPVITLEAMKMEHVHLAPIAGSISAIDVTEGEQVTTGKIVVEIEASGA